MKRIVVKKDGLYGAINELGKMVVEAKYEDMRNFSHGLAAVCKDDKWGYIDVDGSQIIDYLYYDAKDFSCHGIAAVKLSSQPRSWGLVRENGDLVDTEAKKGYYFIDSFNPEGYARVGISGGYQIISIDGSHVGTRAYKTLSYIREENIFIGDPIGKACLIDVEGRVIVEAEKDYDEIYYPRNGLCQVSKDGKYGYIDLEGRLVIPLKYEAAYEFSDSGLAYVVCENGLGGYINKEDEFIIPPIYESGSSFKFGLAAVAKDGEYIFIYENGNKAINHTFKYAGGFAECGLAKTELFQGGQGLVRPDSSIALTLKKECELAEFIGTSRVTKFKARGKEALINSQGKIITGLNYDEIIISADSNLNAFLRNGLWGYLDDEGNEVIDNIYKVASEFTEYNSALVGAYNPIENKIVDLYINDKDKIIDHSLMDLFNKSFRDKYSKVYRFKDGLALAVKKEKTKILNSYGQEIITKDFQLRVGNNSLLVEEIEGPEEEFEEYVEDHRSDNFQGYYDENNFAIDIVYEIVINLKGNCTREKTKKFIEENFHKDDIVEVEESMARVLWEMPAWASGGDIDKLMYYILDANKLGKYYYYRVN